MQQIPVGCSKTLKIVPQYMQHETLTDATYVTNENNNA